MVLLFRLGMSFGLETNCNFNTLIFDQETCKAYSEARYVALGFLGKRLHVL